jgi:penicillin-binding protein A
MNKSIARLFVVVLLLFALLIVWTSRWTVFSASALQNDPLNKLSLYQSWTVKKGQILADDGQVLAKSVRASSDTWKRQYPTGSLFAQTVGYANVFEGQFAGIEKYRQRALSGNLQTTLNSVFGPISTQTQGDDVYTTLDPTAQTMAKSLLDGRVGSVVAIVPQTGAVKVMYSNPTSDDNKPFAKCPPLSETQGIGCQTNLATQAYLAPGSTFKIVTATAALDTGKYTPDSMIDGKSPIIDSGVPLQNDDNTSYPDETLTYALTNSINTIFAQVGESLGKQTMQEYMQRFGFYSEPPLDYPSSEMNASGEYEATKNGPKLLLPVSAPCTNTANCVDIGRMSIGQDKLGVTPLQMAMVVSTVADGGKLMQPRLTNKVVNPDGQVVQSFAPKLQDQVMKPGTATELKQMMTDVVEEGTGQAANLEGLNAAGKTGTASVGSENGEPLDNAWFIGFAPVSDPKIAVAVVLPKIPNGYGGTYAAPVAAQIMKKLLSEGY